CAGAADSWPGWDWDTIGCAALMGLRPAGRAAGQGLACELARLASGCPQLGVESQFRAASCLLERRPARLRWAQDCRCRHGEGPGVRFPPGGPGLLWQGTDSGCFGDQGPASGPPVACHLARATAAAPPKPAGMADRVLGLIVRHSPGRN